MANELMWRGTGTGTTNYALVRNRVGQIWNTSGGTGAFEAYTVGVYSSYPVSAVEEGTSSNFFKATMPAAIAAGVYGIEARRQIAGSAAETDPTVAQGEFNWNGTVQLPLSDLATSGQIGQVAPIRLARGIAVSGFPFKMVSSADHLTAFVSGVVSGQISRDGGSFGALQSGAFTEIGLGFYKVNFTSGDLLATTVALSFSAAGISGGTADQRDMIVILQRTSGQ
jgi:hypothetical protein